MDGFADRAPLPPPPEHERPPCPVPTPADVVALMMPDNYPYPKSATMIAGLLGAAACARVGFLQATRIRLGEHWSPERPGRLLVPDERAPRPAYLLPIAQLAFRRIRDAYDRKEGDLLFAEGEPTSRHETLHFICTRIGERMGIDTRSIVPRMHDFFDMTIPPGTSGEMVLAVSGPRCFRRNVAAPNYVVPLPKLRRFLEENHPLAGAASAFTGKRGLVWIRSQPRNLPEPSKHRWKEVSPAFEQNPVVLELRAVAWPKNEKKWKKFRLDLRDRYFDHLHALKKEGKLRLREVVELFRANKHLIRGWEMMRLVPDPIERTVAEWKQIWIGAYAGRRPGESTHALWKRVAIAERCGIKSGQVRRWWIEAGVLKRRRGRPRKTILRQPRRKRK
ncbi:hypothetical protein XH87_11615 [Bradyrhizobium sp. CCBAU 53415]|nr:hypothetical protein [Bradyrhizobium sp. CCBAU 53415]